MVYQSIIESILNFSIIVLFPASTTQDRKKLNSIIKTCEKLIGTKLARIEDVFEARANRKLEMILKDPYHPSNKYFEKLTSGIRLKCLKGNDRFVKSTFGSLIKLQNKNKHR